MVIDPLFGSLLLLKIIKLPCFLLMYDVCYNAFCVIRFLVCGDSAHQTLKTPDACICPGCQFNLHTIIKA